MNFDPRQREDYSDRQIAAARRVLVDLGHLPLSRPLSRRAGGSGAELEVAVGRKGCRQGERDLAANICRGGCLRPGSGG